MNQIESAKKEIAKLVIEQVANILADLPDPKIREVRSSNINYGGFISHTTSIDLELAEGSLTIQYSYRTTAEVV